MRAWMGTEPLRDVYLAPSPDVDKRSSTALTMAGTGSPAWKEGRSCTPGHEWKLPVSDEDDWQLRERMADLHDQARFVRTVLIALAVVALILLASWVAPLPGGQ